MNNIEINLDAFRNGDMKEFEKLYEQTNRMVLNVIYKMVLDRKEAEDLAHDVYVNMYDKRHTLKHNHYMKAWVYRLAVNHTKNHLNRKKWWIINREQIAKFYLQQQTDTSDEGISDIQLILSRIPMKYRLPIILKDIEALSYEDIAGVLGVPVGTVRSRLNRGRSQLKELYVKEYSHG